MTGWSEKALKTDHFNCTFAAAGLADIGLRRQSNQDEVLLLPERGFFAVTDGMGGLSGGGVASAFVKRAMPQMVESCAADWSSLRRSARQVGEQLQDAVGIVSALLYEQGNTTRPYRYGATVVLAQLYGDSAVVVWLGDSRGYVLRAGEETPEQLTEDMNVAGRMVRAGELTKEEALHRPESSRLTAFVGMQPPAAPGLTITPVRPGDRLLLCSDGLYGMVPEPELARLLRAGDDPEAICRSLVAAANENGGEDNISAVCVLVS